MPCNTPEPKNGCNHDTVLADEDYAHPMPAPSAEVPWSLVPHQSALSHSSSLNVTVCPAPGPSLPPCSFPHVPSASLSAGKAHKLQEAHLSEFVRLDCLKSIEPLVDLQQPDFGGASHCDGSTRECRFTGPQ